MSIIIHIMLMLIIKGAGMRVTQDVVRRHREELIQAAARMLRERGVEATGVTDVCRAAGLTHGAFYRHFESKEALVLVACEAAFNWRIADLADETKPGDGAPERIAQYLSATHRDTPAAGCPVAALAIDAARSGQPLAGVLAKGMRHYIDQFARLFPMRKPSPTAQEAQRDRAVAALAAMVGGLILARATVSADPDLSDQILRAVRDGMASTSAEASE